MWTLPETETGLGWAFVQVRVWQGVVIKMVVDLLAARVRPRRPQFFQAAPWGPQREAHPSQGSPERAVGIFSASQFWGCVFSTDLVKFKLSTAQTLKACHRSLGTHMEQMTLRGLC